MAYVAVDKNKAEAIYDTRPFRLNDEWDGYELICIPKGTIKKILGFNLTWDDEPIELE